VSTHLPEELPPNFEFGGYVIRACIGRGGMARVYRAEQAALQRPVALKVLDRWVLEQPQGSQRFLREARAAAAIKHPNVVDILDVGVWQERPYIVMELLSGTDLETHLARHGVMSDSDVAGLALPIIAGMMAVHDAGVVHRDLKPSNIFLSNGPDGEIVPKVLDFGVSKFDKLNEPAKAQTKTREIIGTPTYMAPEALNGVRELGPRADQYALGAVLYECCTGRPPFEGETLLELLKAIAVGNVPAPRSIRPEISIPLEDAIARAMNANPRARFETLREFGRALWPVADDRSKSIWSRSFGNGRPATFGGGDTGGLVLLARERMLEPPVSSKPSSTSLHKLSWVGLFLAAGALASWVVFGRGGEETPEVEHASATPAAAAAPAASSPSVERRSLLGETARPVAAAAAEPSEDEPPAASSASTPEPSSRARMASEVRAALTRSPTTQRVARAAPPAPQRSSAAEARRKRPVRADAPEGADSDTELEGLFATPEPAERRVAADGELEGMFPRDEPVTVGANGAPLPD
jgi:eukaryotic-like serine/threonine-protein kinase